MTRRSLSREEARLWAAVAGTVKPLVGTNDPPPLGGVITLTKHNTTGSASDRQAGALSQPLAEALTRLLWEQEDSGLLFSDVAILILCRLAEECAVNGDDMVLRQIKDAQNLKKQIS